MPDNRDGQEAEEDFEEAEQGFEGSNEQAGQPAWWKAHPFLDSHCLWFRCSLVLVSQKCALYRPQFETMSRRTSEIDLNLSKSQLVKTKAWVPGKVLVF